MLPPRAPFNASWFINGKLIPLVEKFFPAALSAGRRKLVMHIDNASAHNSRMTRSFFGHNPLKRHPHLVHSPDLSTAGFFLFGKTKSALIRREIPDEINLLEAVTEILNGISEAELQRVFGCNSSTLCLQSPKKARLWTGQVESPTNPRTTSQRPPSHLVDSFIV
jgi:hypothetical protein